MSTIYLTEPGMEVKKDGGTIVFVSQNGQKSYVPSNYVTALVLLTNAQVNHGVIMEMLRNNGKIIYMDRYGAVLGSIGNIEGSGRMLVRQVETYRNETKRMKIAIHIVEEKIAEEARLLTYYNKSVKKEDISSAAKKLQMFKNICNRQNNVESLMGIEGMCAKIYFECFQHLIKDREFKWNGRKKHPAPDPVNALLSFTYALVEKDIRIALADLDVALSVGFLHALDNRKDSLVYDILELFRSKIADRFVLRIINLNMVSVADFEIKDGRCLMTKEFLKKFISAYEEYMGDFGEGESKRQELLQSVRKFKKMVVDVAESENALAS